MDDLGAHHLAGRMADQLLVGGVTSLINLVIHALLIGAVLGTVRRLSIRDSKIPLLLQYMLVIVATGTLLVAGHLLEVFIWAEAYAFANVAPPGADLVNFAFGNYTTLGGSGVTPAAEWRLLGPMTALNGILLIGWSTAVVIELLRHSSHAAEKSAAASQPQAAQAKPGS